MASANRHGRRESVAIIGGGVAGLCAGCYAQMNGYKATIFEMHSLPGGVCTAWQRNGYTIDSCVHWLLGSGPASGFHKLWKEVGALRGLTIVDLDEFMRIELKGSPALVFYRDVDRFERHLLELGPEDGKTIRELANAIRRFTRFDMPVDKAPELSSVWDKLVTGACMMPLGPAFIKWRKVTVADFAKRLKSSVLRDAFGALAGEAAGFPMLGLIMMLAWQEAKIAGYPLGGSLPFVRNIEKRFHDLGGQIRYSARVEKILVEARPDGRGDRAIGVRLADGSEHRADVVISAADGRSTIFDLLGGRFVDEEVRKPYEGGMETFPPLLYVSLGIADPLDNVPQASSGISFPLNPSVEIDGKARDRLSMNVYNFDRALAPAGKTVVIVMITAGYDRWKTLSADPARYRAEKGLVGERVLDALEQRLPGIRSKVEMIDVATPTTWERYTGNWRGSYEGWLMTGAFFGSGMKKTLPGLGNFRMVGEWVSPGGGLPPAVSTGRDAIQILCREDGKRFVTSEP
ncbi:MAG: NAD(P)/FAD-dependent oxidoreductase [Candidatus Bipolaricaulis sp.]|nr:NAD(P)/FAD-dependent oxidoreductase [Candidatus Bipolaricaulis sp.]